MQAGGAAWTGENGVAGWLPGVTVRPDKETRCAGRRVSPGRCAVIHGIAVRHFPLLPAWMKELVTGGACGGRPGRAVIPRVACRRIASAWLTPSVRAALDVRTGNLCVRFTACRKYPWRVPGIPWKGLRNAGAGFAER